MVKTLHIHGSTGDSTILVGETLENLKHYVPSEKVVIITDSDVRRFYRGSFPPFKTLTIGTGEGVKTLDTVGYLYEQLIEAGADRWRGTVRGLGLRGSPGGVRRGVGFTGCQSFLRPPEGDRLLFTVASIFNWYLSILACRVGRERPKSRAA